MCLKKMHIEATLHINYTFKEPLKAHNYRLLIKETLKIQEQYAFSSLNRNVGSLKLKLWSGD